MLITSRDAISRIETSLTGVAHSKEISIFGNSGLKKFLSNYDLRRFSPIYGHFHLVENNGYNVRISTDHFGLSRLYIYKSGHHWAISDSMYDLANFAASSGFNLTPYPASAYAFLLKDGVGQQLSSFKTPIAEIELIPHWQNVVIDSSGYSFIKKSYLDNLHDIKSSIRDAGQFFSSLVVSYLEYDMTPFVLLSGGLDSRCTVSAMTSGLNSEQRRMIGTYTMKTAEFAKEKEVAESVSKAFGLTKLNAPKPQRTPNWEEWRKCFLGSQSYFHPFSRFTVPDVAFGGSCAENIKPFYPWPDGIGDIKVSKDIPKDFLPRVLSDIIFSVRMFDGPHKDKLSDDNRHYQSFRNRFHFGRDVRDTIFNYPPLVYSIVKDKKNSEDVAPLHRIIYELASQEVFDHRFDSASKDFVGVIPNDWSRVSYKEVQPYKREIFIGTNERTSYTDLLGEGAMDDGRLRDGNILSAQFFDDCEGSIRFAESRALLSAGILQSAKTQLNHIRANGHNALPFLAPALMGVLCLGLARF